jgi:hypothetical protein
MKGSGRTIETIPKSKYLSEFLTIYDNGVENSNYPIDVLYGFGTGVFTKETTELYVQAYFASIDDYSGYAYGNTLPIPMNMYKKICASFVRNNNTNDTYGTFGFQVTPTLNGTDLTGHLLRKTGAEVNVNGGNYVLKLDLALYPTAKYFRIGVTAVGGEMKSYCNKIWLEGRR